MGGTRGTDGDDNTEQASGIQASGIREIAIEYRPLPSQKRFHDSKARFKGFSGPIGSGKSQALCQEAIRLSFLNPGRTGLIGAPTYPMLRDATVAALLETLERNRIPHEVNRAENFVILRGIRSKILFRAVEEFERLRGSNLAWFGLDELTYTSKEAWVRLEGRLRDPEASRLCGFAVWTPKGYDWVYERFIESSIPGYETVLAQPFENRYLLERVPDYYERLRNSYDERFYQQEILGEYLSLHAGRVYHAFERAGNVVKQTVDPRVPLEWALDFNVDPMSSVVAQIVGHEVRVLDEIVLSRATTVQACEEFARRFPQHPAGLTVYADATGQRMQTTGESDVGMLKSFFRSGEYGVPQFSVPRSNPPVRDRVLLMNSKLCSAEGARTLIVDPKCTELVRDFEQVTYKENSQVIDKEQDPRRTHLSDALGYLVWQKFGNGRRIGEQSAAVVTAKKGDTVFDIDREHPEFITRKRVWKKYRDLYVGGEQFRNCAQEYLIRRQREPGDVYLERLSRVFYENYIGSIVDWYAATLFGEEPVLTFEGKNEGGKQFFSALVDDVDRKGSSLADFFRRQFTECLITGNSFVLVDFPRLAGRVETRGEEDAIGASRAYLVEYSPEDLINWSLDERGNFEWVVLRTKSIRKEKVEDPDWRVETKWAYYDKQNYRIYCETREGSGAGARTLVDEGQHSLSKLGQVPLFGLRIPEGLWMLNRSGSLQLEHFNKSNALSWGMTMGLFSMPVVYSERDWSQMIGESYYIQMGPQDRFGWTEPEGKVFQIAQDNLSSLQEEIYRVCYLAQAGGSLGGGGRQSALSKQIDFSITQEVLRAYGDAVKEQIRRVLKAIEAAREDGLSISVTGMDEFDIADLGTELDDAKALLALGVESPTLKREMFKKLALKFLCDSRQDVKDKVAAEIEAS